jgi:hypothetical protein
MKQPYRYRVNRREYGDGLHNPHPRILLQISDCYRHIDLEFELDSPHRRLNSFHKVPGPDRRAGGAQGRHGHRGGPL